MLCDSLDAPVAALRGIRAHHSAALGPITRAHRAHRPPLAVAAADRHGARVNPVLGALSALASLVTPPRGVDAPAFAGLPYRAPHAGPGRPPRADVYLPDAAGLRPSVVWVHGGGFTVGSRAMKPMRLLATACRRAGWASLTFDYRLVPRGGGALPAAVDAAAAWAWWHAQTERFALDPQRVVLAGLSAGGCAALLAAPALDPKPAGVVSVFALYDFDSLTGAAAGLFARVAAGPGVNARRAASPLHTPLCAAPTLLMHGTGDTLTPASAATAYAARRLHAGLDTTTRLYDGAPHAFFNSPARPPAPQATLDLVAWLGALPR